MVRPKARELTERELEIMRVFWDSAERQTVAEVREALGTQGRELAYTTVATLVRILEEKGFLKQVTQERPFLYEAERSFDEVAGRLVSDLVQRVFGGSREQLLVRLLGDRQLTATERDLLQQLVDANDEEPQS